MNTVRYALYFSPEPGTPLGAFGSHWLGRDCISGDALEHSPLEGLARDWVQKITAVPRIYGFHATLKAPFHLSSNTTMLDLDEALEAFSMQQYVFKGPALEISALDDFIALRPSEPCQKLDMLAAECVRTFDHFRAAASAKEEKKRQQANLTERQIGFLKEWGYPYVMEEYCFHMTLTDRLPRAERDAVMAVLSERIQDVMNGKAWIFDSLTLMHQTKPDAAFEAVKAYPFKPISADQ